MRIVLQIICVVAIALGAGLFAGGSYLEPSLDLRQLEVRNAADLSRLMDRFGGRDREVAAMLRGFGIGFITLGGLGLVVPWINILATWFNTKQSNSMPQ